jgi:hypothetical protein
LAVDEAADGPDAIGVEALEEIRVAGNGIEVRIGPIRKYGFEALPPRGGVYGGEALGKGFQVIHIHSVAEAPIREGPLTAGHGHGDAALPVLLEEAAHGFSQAVVVEDHGGPGGFGDHRVQEGEQAATAVAQR